MYNQDIHNSLTYVSCHKLDGCVHYQFSLLCVQFRRKFKIPQRIDQ